MDWKDVNYEALLRRHNHYSSLMGVNVMGLYTNDPTTRFNFPIKTTYMDFDCRLLSHNITAN
jgi:hypothetical protein